MALVGVKLQTLVSEPDALTTRPPPCVSMFQKSENLWSGLKFDFFVFHFDASLVTLAFVVFEIGQNLHKIRWVALQDDVII